MRTIQSILVVVDRHPASAQAVTKALLLARSSGARVELFMCEAERAYALSQSYVTTGLEDARRACVESARQYLSELRDTSAATDLDLSVEAQCESPHYESIVHKVIRSEPDLVIKNAVDSATSGSLDVTDWLLMRACPATVMLARGRPWPARPHFLAAVDASTAETTGLAAAILGAAGIMARCVGADLDVVYAQGERDGCQTARDGAAGLANLIRTEEAAGAGIHVLSGTPEEKLAPFARGRHCDALLLGALTHRPGLTAQVGTLTSKLVDELTCDLILVKPREFVSPFQQPRRVFAHMALGHERCAQTEAPVICHHGAVNQT